MTRWKDTLCGSVILQNQEVSPEIFKAHHSEMMSCGGKFLPRSERFQIMTPKNDMINLANENQVVVRESDGRMIRYGEAQGVLEEMEQAAREMARLDMKPIK